MPREPLPRSPPCAGLVSSCQAPLQPYVVSPSRKLCLQFEVPLCPFIQACSHHIVEGRCIQATGMCCEWPGPCSPRPAFSLGAGWRQMMSDGSRHHQERHISCPRGRKRDWSVVCVCVLGGQDLKSSGEAGEDPDKEPSWKLVRTMHPKEAGHRFSWHTNPERPQQG